jgi:hypothetical protein
MWNEALIGLLNVKTRSYLMLKTFHRFASPVGESGLGFFFEHFLLISSCKSSDVDRSFRTELVWQG